MSNPDYYGADELDRPHRHRSRRTKASAQYKDSSAAYVEQRDGAGRASRHMELVRAPQDDSDIEEVHRDFPPGQYDARRAPRRDARATRSLERGGNFGDNDVYYAGRSRGGDASGATRGRRGDERSSRARSASRGQELVGAAAGAGLAVGAKEIWDHQNGKHRRKSVGRRAAEDAAIGVAGAVAGDVAARQYVRRYASRSRNRHGVDDGPYYAETDYDTPKRPRTSRRKSLGEAALAALGVGAVANSGRDRPRGGSDGGRRHRSRRGSSSSSDSYSRSHSRGGRGSNDATAKIQQAAQAALAAAAAEAWRSRKEPGGFFDGPKARRILTAAAGAGGIDALADRDPDRHSKRNMGEGAIGGLLLNRIINGSRGDDFSASGGGRSRSRSRSRGRHGGSGGGGGGGSGGLKEVATAALAAGAGKKILDKVRSRSRGGGRDRRHSSSDDSRSPAPRSRRSRSVSAMIDRGMAKIGIGEAEAARTAGADRGGASRSVPRSEARGGARRRRGSSSSSSSDSDFSLSDEEKARKKLRGKELLTAGLATVATVHAAHEVYESMEKRDKRRKAVLEGHMTSGEARRAKSKATVQDLAALGLAGLGIKGAVSTWQEAKEHRTEVRDLETKLERHRRIAAERGAKKTY
ncbi:MAG: hypothetical protein M1832_005206 [Thelocarpon impressellum]|nr:MAG: hypothetical protein M1832_005206 [Thelocarpon impressellum]